MNVLNIIWPFFIIISFGFAILTGRVEQINSQIFKSSANGVQLCISLLGTVCLWTGIIKIASETTLIKKMNGLIKPFMKLLFPELKEDSQAFTEISMNMIANFLGLGNAATPLGLKAMKTMQKDNVDKNTLSNSMLMFIVVNTASLQIIPTTVIGIRASFESINPTGIVIPVWIASIAAAVVGITATKILIKKQKL